MATEVEGGVLYVCAVVCECWVPSGQLNCYTVHCAEVLKYSGQLNCYTVHCAEVLKYSGQLSC